MARSRNSARSERHRKWHRGDAEWCEAAKARKEAQASTEVQSVDENWSPCPCPDPSHGDTSDPNEDAYYREMGREYERLEARGMLTCKYNCEKHLELIRVADMDCTTCGKLYSRHPYCKGAYDMLGAIFYLHVACDGRHLKL